MNTDNEKAKKKLHILRHSIGLDDSGKGNEYRNHYVCPSEVTDGKLCQELCVDGLMIDQGSQKMCGGMHVYQVTDKGKEFVRENAPPPIKISRSKQRYQRFLKADLGLSFREYLKLEQIS